ncbi:hypothetical protein [Salinarimonas sp.]|uniref:hypothetical protein n=1 Tax=Salinarimonas sp. TaxID=2766526 RepID=UPI0032D8D764
MIGRAAGRAGGFTSAAGRALLIAAIGVGLGAATTATRGWAQAPDIDWGADTSAFANDRECDDPRFEGPGMAKVLDDANIGADASDCFELFKRGRIVLRADAPSVAVAGTDLDFGDDTGRWANDGECDDPRFEGEGMAAVLVEEDRLRDASDCRRLYEQGAIALRGDAAPAAPGRPDVAGVDFGDDTGRWANDGECDDPRFDGEGMAAVLVEEDRLRDASDCRRLYEQGAIALRGDAAPAAPGRPDVAGVDFGDDTGRWANDGECDDPRFEGEGMAAVLVEEDRLRDATDCRRLYELGAIDLIGETRADVAPAAPAMPAAPAAPSAPAGIDFGDDSSRWANDGECDDPRFEGEGMAVATVEDDRMRDASDCSRLFAEGRITLR